MEKQADIIVVGSGVAGLFCALHLPKEKKILIITKDAIEHSDSFLAQGGICILKNEEDYECFFEDTMKAGHYENNRKSVEIMIRNSPDIIDDLIGFGVEFEKENGQLKYTKEGAHSTARILYHEDLTGKELTSKLLAQVQQRENIEIREYITMIDLIHQNNTCMGVVVSEQNGEISKFYSHYVVLACGGVGGLYEHSTNYPHITGDGVAIAIKNGIELLHTDYVQIHPTTLFSNKKGRRFLISESVRGEGAVLYNSKMERFVDELLPRDTLTNEIYKQMKKEGSQFVWLSMKDMDRERIKKRFPNIYKKCLEEGYDVTKECIPVTPAQHYYMGGIKVNLNSKTSMEHLYAIGETSCNGVHGANRLASNSLLESLVFAKRAAIAIAKSYRKDLRPNKKIDLNQYKDLEMIKSIYKQMVRNTLERKKA